MGRIHDSSAGNVGPHFLLLPFVEQGHMNPMLNLASQLAAITTPDCKVTFVNATQPASDAASSNGSSNNVQHLHIQEDDSMGDKLKFAILSSTPPSAPGRPASRHKNELEHVSMSSRHTVFKQKIAALENLQPLIEKMVLDSMASARPISCIVCDVLLWKWVQKVADKHGIRLALFVPCNALTFFTAFATQIDKGVELEELLVSQYNLPAFGDPRRHGLISVEDSPEVRMEKLKYYCRLLEGIVEVGAEYLVNSFEQLEDPVLPLIEAAGVKMTFVAPSVGAGEVKNSSINVQNRRTQLAGSALVQQEECLEWLGRQERGSVLYISLGSEGVLEEAQMQAIAMGIDQSGHRFLWVVRPDMPAASRPPEEFRQRCSGEGRGMFVGWAPQRAVLQHAAVGAFLTHSGWNSTLESLSYGVPMMCLPLMSDQPLNANLVHSYWQVGLRLQASSAGDGDGGQSVVTSGHVEEAVRALMIPGSRFSINAQRCAQLVAAGHRAHLNLNSFVHNVMTRTSI